VVTTAQPAPSAVGTESPEVGAAIAPTGREIARQAKWLAVGQVVADTAFYGTVVVLAALVPPAAFGTVAAGMAIVRIAAIIMESGTGGAIIAARDLTADQARRTVAVNVALGAGLSLGLALAAGPMASIVASGGDAAVLRVLGFALTLQALTVVPVALLRKAMDFRRAAVVNSISALVTALIALSAGVLGFGVWALVARQLLFPALLAWLAWRAARPIASALPRARAGTRLRRAPRGVSGFLVVGASGLLAMTLDNLLVGAVTDARQLAFYALAFTLGFVPLTMISWRLGQVLFPAAAATLELQVVGRRTARAMRLLALVLCPLVPVSLAIAPAAIPAILGAEWTPMVVPFAILMVVGSAHAVANMIGESLSGTGNIGFRARCDVPWAAVTLGGVAALGALAGIRGAAIAHLITVIPLVAAYVLLGSRRIGTTPLDLWRAMRGVLVPVGGQAAVTIGVYTLAPGLPGAVRGGIAAGAGVATLALLLRLAPSRPVIDLREALRLARTRRSGRATASRPPMARLDDRPSRPARVAGIEGLRALAATGIVLLHSWQYSDPQGAVSLGPMTRVVLDGLPLSVMLFFTLSAFLLYRPFATAIIRGGPRPSFVQYLRNRALRILPAYWVIFLIVALVLQSALVWGPAGQARVAAIHDPGLLVRNLLLVQAYDPGTVLTGIGPAWSLAVEAVFYLALPLLVLGAARMASSESSPANRRLAALSPAIVLLGLGISGKLVAAIVGAGDGWDSSWHTVVERSFWGQADLFAFGIAVAVARVELEDGRLRLPVWWRGAAWGTIALIALAAGLVPIGLPLDAYGTFAAVGFAVLLALVVLPGPSPRPVGIVRLLESRPFVATGVISYSLFLWNDPITRFLAAHDLTVGGHAGLVADIALVFALSWAVSAATYRWVERPALRRKARRGVRPSHRPSLAGELKTAP
jgi:teichuronic acid exporter